MTLEELDAIYTEANWLIARRVAIGAGKALLLGGESLSAVTEEIAALYGLSTEERGSLAPVSAHQALAGMQKSAASLLGGGAVLTNVSPKRARTGAWRRMAGRSARSMFSLRNGEAATGQRSFRAFPTRDFLAAELAKVARVGAALPPPFTPFQAAGEAA